MGTTELFLHEETLSHIFERLRVENDPNRRRILRYAAIAEEDRYGLLQARLDRVEAWVCEGEARIARQRRLVDRFGADGPHRAAAERLLANLEELQALLVIFQNLLRKTEWRVAP